MVTKLWEIISHISTARHLCFAVVIPDSRVLVVGGETGKYVNNSMEIATSSIMSY